MARSTVSVPRILSTAASAVLILSSSRTFVTALPAQQEPTQDIAARNANAEPQPHWGYGNWGRNHGGGDDGDDGDDGDNGHDNDDKDDDDNKGYEGDKGDDSSNDNSSKRDLWQDVVDAAAWGWGNNKGWGNLKNNGQCGMESCTLPSTGATSSPSYPSPTGTLKHVVVGRGTQNYTCSSPSAEQTPTANGAVANLYDASCIASRFPSFSSLMPTIALQLPNPCKPDSGMPSDKLVNMDLIGHHYFTDKSPVFNLDQGGFVTAKKEGETPAPANAPGGRNGQGDGAVAWLYLTGDGSEGASWKQIYRVETAGGSPPKTCEGMPEAFEVDYAAQYWFYD